MYCRSNLDLEEFVLTVLSIALNSSAACEDKLQTIAYSPCCSYTYTNTHKHSPTFCSGQFGVFSDSPWASDCKY